MFPAFRHILGLVLASLILSSCSLLPEEKDKTKGWSAQKLYTEASGASAEGDYALAIKYYEILESRYPFGKFAMQSQLNVAYVYYRFSEPESALAAADRFIKLYPRHPATAYAHYLKGLINFNRSLGFLDRFMPTDTSQRDPGAAADSYKDFGEVVRQFPGSDYAEDSQKRMLYLRNNLARHEIHVARYYIDRGAFLAAANRAIYVVENYQRTPAMRDALLIMIQAYEELGMDELADDANRVLVLNEEQDIFIQDPSDFEEKTWGAQLWDYLELDKN